MTDSSEKRQVSSKMNHDPLLAKALRELLDRYVGLVNSGRIGHWDPETEGEVAQARAALRLANMVPYMNSPVECGHRLAWLVCPDCGIDIRGNVVNSNETEAQLEPTREHLQKLVQRTADHWLSLQLTHTIAWEGAIDAAMEAACNEIRRLDPNAQKASEPRHGAAQDFVEFDPYGGVRVDMARYLRSPAGQAQLKELGGKKANSCAHTTADPMNLSLCKKCGERMAAQSEGEV
jgi:hypothetical protein